MKYSVANPIYDSVFKFLMEDERIAKTILSALLKKEVVSVEMRRHEHPNVTRDKISMFRIDFAARVKEENGEVRLILIELQKTWIDTETLRFRRYLAAQYNAEENIVKKGDDKGFAVPMVAVYLLGHRVGKLKEPVVYVSRQAFDYKGNTIKEGMKDPFVNSLTHDSIIVQIPLLRGKVNNRLEKVLSVFDQSRRDRENQQMVCLDPTQYADDSEMLYILHRLSMAAMSAEVRQEMNDEDEFFSILEARETSLMKANAQLKKANAQLNETNAQLNETNAQLNEANAQLNETSAQLNKTSAQLNETNAQLNETSAQLNEANVRLNEANSQLVSMARLMLQNGMPMESVALVMKRSVDELRSLLAQE